MAIGRTVKKYLERDEDTPMQLCGKVHRSNVAYFLTEQEGKAIQEVLRRYVGEELKPQLGFGRALDTVGEDLSQMEKDIIYITGLADLFGE